MLDAQAVRDQIAALKAEKWEGVVYRHMFAGIPPDRENTGGARWNPPGVAAIYASLERDTALAEAEHRIRLEPVPIRPDIKRTIHKIRVALHAVIDLGTFDKLQALGIEKATLQAIEKSALSSCQLVGGQMDWFEYDGLLVPSARHAGCNLVIYPSNRENDYVFDVIESEEIHS